VDTYTVISAFSGIGGLDLGISAAIKTRTVAYVEREITCARVLAERASEGLLDEAPIYSDIRTFPTEVFAGKVDGIIGGFPCQPFSVAGLQRSADDPRNMWPDTIRLIREIRPSFAFLENVPGLVSHEYFGTILGDLAQAGFDAEWGCFTASEIGASHRRERVFILAYARDTGSQGTTRYDCHEKGTVCAGVQSDGDRVRGRTGRGSNELAHAKEYGVQEPRPTDQSESRHPPTASVSDGKELAYSEHYGQPTSEIRRSQQGEVHNRGKEGQDSTRQLEGVCSTGDAPEELAYSDSSGSREDIQQAELRTTGTEQSPSDSGKTGQGEDDKKQGWGDGYIYRPGLPEFPPGPGDPRWGWIIEHYPELAPARCKVHETESSVRNVDDAWKIEDRVAALMMLGNAVVPAQAEHAFRTLASR